MADWLTPEQRSRNMAAIRSSGTSPERGWASHFARCFPDGESSQGPTIYLAAPITTSLA